MNGRTLAGALSFADGEPPAFRPLLLSAPVAVALHAALLWGLMLWPSPAPVVQPSPASFAIDLDEPHAAAVPASVPDPAPVPLIPARSVAEPRPVVTPSPRPLRKPVAPPPVAEAAERHPPASDSPASPPETAPVAAPAPIPTPTPIPTPAMAVRPPSPAAEVTRWQGALLAHLERHKRYPRDAQMRRQEGAGAVRFVMDRHGRIVSARLERSTGVESLDKEGLALIERAQPLPLPPGGTGDQIDLVVPVRFFLR